MSRRGIIGIAVGVALVAVIAAAAAWWSVSRPASADETARAYLAALERGDAAAVRAMREPVDEKAERLLEEAFTGADEYVSEPRIDGMQADGADRTAVQASARLGDERRDIAFTLLRGDDGRFTVAAGDGGTLTVRAALDAGAAPLPAVRVGDALLPTGTAVVLLPARYTVTAAPSDLLTGSADVVAGTREDATVELAASLSPDATAAAQAQIETYATACAEPAEAVPDHCGLIVPWAADLARLDRIAFRIEAVPTVSLEPETSSFAATGGVIVATARGTAHDGSEAAFTYRSEDWALRGSIGFREDALVLTVR